MKQFLIFSFLLIGVTFFSSTYTLAQTEEAVPENTKKKRVKKSGDLQDVVYLKNGSIIRGTLLSSNASEFVKIETLGGNIFVFTQQEIKQITQEETVSVRPVRAPKKNGYSNTTEFGFLVGQGTWNTEAAFNLSVINGYRLNQYVTVGVGMAFNAYYQADTYLFPMYADVRGDLLSSWITPFYYANLGYGFRSFGNNFENQQGGILYGLGVGVKMRGDSGAAWIFSVGYQQQHTQSTQPDWWWGGGGGFVQKRNFKRIALKTGFSF